MTPFLAKLIGKVTVTQKQGLLSFCGQISSFTPSQLPGFWLADFPVKNRSL
jgi:hypothetical protein